MRFYSSSLQRCFAFVKRSNLVSPDKVVDFYNPEHFTDYKNLINFHELEYKISMGSEYINPRHEEYQRYLINQWKTALRNIAFHFRHVILITFRHWLDIHSKDPKEWAKNRINNEWYDPVHGMEGFEDYIENLGLDEVNDQLENWIKGNVFGIRPIDYFSQYIDDVPEWKEFLTRKKNDYYLEFYNAYDFDEIVNNEEYFFNNYVKSKYGNEFDLYYNNFQEDEDPPEDWEIIANFLKTKGYDEYKLTEALKETMSLEDFFENYILQLQFEDFIHEIPYDVLEPLMQKIYENEAYNAYDEVFGKRTDESRNRVNQSYEMVLKADPRKSSIQDIAMSISLALNTVHSSGSMFEYFPEYKIGDYKNDTSKYIYSWEEYAEKNGLDYNNYELQTEWQNEHFSNMTTEDLNMISNLDSTAWNKELLKDGFLIPLGGGVREFHEHSRISSTLINIYKNCNK